MNKTDGKWRRVEATEVPTTWKKTSVFNRAAMLLKTTSIHYNSNTPQQGPNQNSFIERNKSKMQQKSINHQFIEDELPWTTRYNFNKGSVILNICNGSYRSHRSYRTPGQSCA